MDRKIPFHQQVFSVPNLRIISASASRLFTSYWPKARSSGQRSVTAPL